MRGKKNGFFNFCFAFIPGCSEMYMGFMKMGLSLMILFWGVVLLASTFLWDGLVFLDFIVWFYRFFHARNLAHASQEELVQMEDRYLFNLEQLEKLGWNFTKAHRKIAAGLLIFFGAILTCQGILDVFEDVLPSYIWRIFYAVKGYSLQIIIGVGIIAVGYRLIRGKKEELWPEEKK